MEFYICCSLVKLEISIKVKVEAEGKGLGSLHAWSYSVFQIVSKQRKILKFSLNELICTLFIPKGNLILAVHIIIDQIEKRKHKIQSKCKVTVINKESLFKAIAVGRNDLLSWSLLQQSWRNIWLKTLVVWSVCCVEGVQCCPLRLEVCATFLFQKSAQGTTEQYPSKKQPLLSVCSVDLSHAAWVMLQFQQMAAKQIALYTSDLWKKCNILVQTLKKLNFLKMYNLLYTLL